MVKIRILPAVSRARFEGTEHGPSVDDSRESLDPSRLDRHHEGRRASSTGRPFRSCLREEPAGRVDDHADDEDADDVEEQDPPERLLDRARHGLARVLKVSAPTPASDA